VASAAVVEVCEYVVSIPMQGRGYRDPVYLYFIDTVEQVPRDNYPAERARISYQRTPRSSC
jgi:hypothetical protein